MTPSKTIVKTIYRGLYWDGMDLTCKKRDGTASNLSGCTATCKMRKGSGSAISLPASIVGNKITIGPIDESTSLALQEGRYDLDVIILWTDTRKRGVYAKAVLDVKTPISI